MAYYPLKVKDNSGNTHVVGDPRVADKADKASPALTGTPTAPTAAAGTNTTQIATTAFVGTALSNLVDGAPGALDTLNELAAALGDDASFATTVTNSLATKAPLESPTFTGTVTLPAATSIGNVSSTEISYVDGVTSAIQTQLNGKASSTHTHTSADVSTVVINAKTASYTLVLGDAGDLVEMGSASAQTLTIPTNASVAFPVGTKIDVLQTGAGECTVSPASGVTLNSEGGKRKVNAQWQAATLIKRATDTWVLIGALKS